MIVMFFLFIKKQITKYNYITEYKRNIKMNGLYDMSSYLPFSYHFNLFILFKKLIDKFNKYNIKYFLSSGGLIGYFRHNKGFIPWDDDLDICVFEKDQKKVRKCLKELEIENNYKFIIGNKIEQIDKIKHENIFIDIFYLKYYKNSIKDSYYHYNNIYICNRFKNEYITKKQIFPLKEVNFYLYLPDGSIYDSIKINIPNKSEEYLNQAYKNWRSNYKINAVHSIINNYLFIKLNILLLIQQLNVLYLRITSLIKFNRN